MKKLKYFFGHLAANVSIALPLGLVAIFCGILWRLSTESWSQFGLNALTTTLGILVTVLFVDYLIKKQEAARQLPQQARAYEDVRLLTIHIVSFWAEVYKSCIPGPGPQTLTQLFQENSFEDMRLLLNLDSDCSFVIPRRTWWDWLEYNLDRFTKNADRILRWHHHILDAQAYSTVHKIATGEPDQVTISGIRALDQKSGFPRPRTLGNYWHPPQGYLETVLQLVTWCETKYQFLKESGITNLNHLRVPDLNWQTNSIPSSMIDPAELERQCKAVEEFRRTNKKVEL